MELAGRLALVTGAGSGIGRAVSQLFAKHGAKLVATDINLPMADQTLELINKLDIKSSGQHMTMLLDVRDSSNVDEVASKILDYHEKPPSIVVHCAGAIVYTGGIFNCTKADWDKSIALNLTGTFLINQKFVSLMKTHEVKGSIVNFSSIAVGGSPRIPEYSAAKAGVEGLTKAIGKEVARFGIRVNAVCPGVVQTALAEDLGEEHRRLAIDSCPMGRLAKPEELAEVCLFLASPKNSYMTATSVICSGGFIR